jgi:hypothetical protein
MFLQQAGAFAESQGATPAPGEHEYKEQTKGGTLGGTVKAMFDLKKMAGS